MKEQDKTPHLHESEPIVINVLSCHKSSGGSEQSTRNNLMFVAVCMAPDPQLNNNNNNNKMSSNVITNESEKLVEVYELKIKILA